MFCKMERRVCQDLLALQSHYIATGLCICDDFGLQDVKAEELARARRERQDRENREMQETEAREREERRQQQEEAELEKRLRRDKKGAEEEEERQQKEDAATIERASHRRSRSTPLTRQRTPSPPRAKVPPADVRAVPVPPAFFFDCRVVYEDMLSSLTTKFTRSHGLCLLPPRIGLGQKREL